MSKHAIKPSTHPRCGYPSKRCENVRALKSNRTYHRFCDFHRARANYNQRKLEERKQAQKKRQLNPSSDGDASPARTDDADWIDALAITDEEVGELFQAITSFGTEQTGLDFLPDRDFTTLLEDASMEVML